jgi:peptide/nickel transport system substrate-binding protein
MKLQAILLAAALAAGASAPLLAQAQTLRWAAQNDILTLDPHSQNHSTTNAIVGHTYETLVRYNATYQIEPALATKWTQVTPTQVRFELRKGVKFHDGTPFTADDVVFSFGRIKQPTSTTADLRGRRQRGEEDRRPHRRLHPGWRPTPWCCATPPASSS